MQGSKGVKLKRNACGIMALMMLLVLLCSVSAIAFEADHDCCGDDCPICECIEQCENVLRQVGSGAVTAIISIIPFALTGTIVIFCLNFFRNETPVSMKIRLNN